MTYDIFKQELAKKLTARMGKEYMILIAPEIGSAETDLINIIHKPSGFTQNCRIASLYKQMSSIKGDSLEVIVKSAMQCFLTLQQKILPLDTNRIIYRLVNHKLCSERHELPHLPFYDMEILFYSSMELGNGLHCNLLINNDLMVKNHLSMKELTTLAYQNTFRLFPSKIEELGEYYLNDLLNDPTAKEKDCVNALIMQILLNRETLADSEKQYVLTNNTSLDGGTALLNMAALKEFSDKLGYDLLILPGTSRGFVIKVWTESTNLADVKQLVKDVCEADDTDALTEQIFCYNHAQEKLELLE